MRRAQVSRTPPSALTSAMPPIRRHHHAPTMKTHTSYLTFDTALRQEIIDITDEVEACRAAAGIREGMVLV